jgi:hypothetical protein
LQKTVPGEAEPAPVEPQAGARCASCGAPTGAPYCATCGERRLHPHEHSLRHFFLDNLREILKLDGHLVRSLRALTLQPGRLTREYMAGRRVRFLRPVELFLMANLVYFVVQPFTNYSGYNTSLVGQTRAQFYSEPAGIERLVTRRVEARDVPFEVYESRFDAKSEVYARTLLLLMVPMFALVALLLQGRRRPLVEHLVFATHYYAWELLVVGSLFLLLYSWAFWPAVAALEGLGVDLIAAAATPLGGLVWLFLTELPTVPLQLAYLAFAFRGAYGSAPPGALVRAVLCIPALLAIVIGYRFLLFWFTYATV